MCVNWIIYLKEYEYINCMQFTNSSLIGFYIDAFLSANIFKYFFNALEQGNV